MKILLAFCEGPHDVAFLSRVLCANNYTDISRSLPIRAYPNEIKTFFIEQRKMSGFKSEDDVSSHLGELIDHILLPSVLVNRNIDKNSKQKLKELPNFKDDKFIFLFSCAGERIKGDKENNLPKPLIEKFLTLVKQDQNSLSEFSKNPFKISIALIPDADDIGVETVKNKFLEDYKEFQSKGLDVYVLAGENGYGCLEDILLPLIEECSNIQEGNKINKEIVLANTKVFIELNKPNSTLEKVDKATINIIGQFEKGLTAYSNAVIIAKTHKYLKGDIIVNNSKCKEIFSFFNNLISKL